MGWARFHQSVGLTPAARTAIRISLNPGSGRGSFDLLEYLGGTVGVLADGAHGGGLVVRHASSVAVCRPRRHGMNANFRRDHAMAYGRRLVTSVAIAAAKCGSDRLA